MAHRHETAARRGRWAVASMFAANGFVMGAWAPQIPLLLPRHQITATTLGLPRTQADRLALAMVEGAAALAAASVAPGPVAVSQICR